MSEPHRITPEHVRSLLDAPPGSQLVLVDGLLEIAPAGQGDGLQIVTREAATDQLGTEPDADTIAALALALTTAVQQLGG